VRKTSPHVLITGLGKGGIGGETAVTITLGQPEMMLLDKIQGVIGEIATVALGVRVKFVKLRLDSMASIRVASRKVLKDPEIGGVDVVINNAR
jgi:NAD(P)-dependent dehydrogenase (short-subunit alcohol dehydrogenase family)